MKASLPKTNPELPLTEVFQIPTVIGHSLARTLADRIIYLDLQPGARLGEDEICQEYHVSRSPVREAFRALEADGLIVRSVRRGVRVTPMGRRDLREVYTCRVMLEGLAAREAATNATAEDLARLRSLIDAMMQALKRRQSRPFFDSNVAFTRAIHESSANATLIRIVAGIEKQALRYRYLAHSQTPEMREISFEGHKSVFEAVVRGDAAAAEKAGQASMRNAHAVILKVVEAQWPAAEEVEGGATRWNAPI